MPTAAETQIDIPKLVICHRQHRPPGEGYQQKFAQVSG